MVYVYDLDGPCKERGFLEGVLSALPGPPLAVPDAALRRCMGCSIRFGPARRRHHCRHCGRLLCHGCSSQVAAPSSFPPSFSAAAGFVSSSSSPPPRSSKRAAASEAGGGSSNNEGRLVVDRLSRTAVRVCGPCHNVLTPGDGW